MPENYNTGNMYKKKERALGEERATFPPRRRTPSFSSSLLDAIYRSIDDEPLPAKQMDKSISRKQSNSAPPSRGGRSNFIGGEDKEITNLRRAIMVETWMERYSTRGSTTSTSDSSRGGLFSSSSETGSSTKGTPRTTQILDKQQQKKQSKSEKGQGLNFTRTKLRALKIYGELKKVKQPISPGGRIASFLNSIFNSGGAKKVKMCSIGALEDVTFGDVDNSNNNNKPKSSSCSTSSFSRSCLSKTPTSSRKSKRSVRFYPVSVIVGEDSRPCGHKCIYGEDPGLMPVTTRKGFNKGPSSVKEEKKNASVREFGLKGFPSYLNYDSDEEEEEEDDDMSCSSSELFELDHLIGIGRYREELPVYETTSLKTNQVIANGFYVN